MNVLRDSSGSFLVGGTRRLRFIGGVTGKGHDDGLCVCGSLVSFGFKCSQRGFIWFLTVFQSLCLLPRLFFWPFFLLPSFPERRCDLFPLSGSQLYSDLKDISRLTLFLATKCQVDPMYA